MVEQWEYKIVYFSAERWTATGLPNDLNEQFDKYGADGWELVGTEALIRAMVFRPASKTSGVVAYFKRRLRG